MFVQPDRPTTLRVGLPKNRWSDIRKIEDGGVYNFFGTSTYVQDNQYRACRGKEGGNGIRE